MRLFTNGKLTVLQTATHRYRWPQKGDPQVVTLKKSATTNVFDDGLLFVDSVGEDVGPALAPYFELKTVRDGGLIDDKRAAILHGDETLTWRTALDGQWPNTVSLSKHRSAYPDWASSFRLGPAPVDEDLDQEARDELADEDRKRAVGFARATLLANNHGLGVASPVSGNVALYRLDSGASRVKSSTGG